MPSIALALQRFSDLLSQPTGDQAEDYWKFPGDRLCECLERDLIPALVPLWTSPSFHQLTLWPVVTWLPGCETPERLLITQLKQAITECAEATCDFVREHSALLDSHFPEAVRRWRRMNRIHLVPPASAPSVSDALSSIRGAMGLCREEWASAQDYFAPRFNVFIPGEGTQSYQRGEFVIDFNPELQYVGNLITRCLLVRAITAIDLLEATTKEFDITLVAAQRPVNAPWHKQQSHIRQLLADLRHACLHAQDAGQAEAAMCMVQIGIEFSARQPDLGWLPPDAVNSVAFGQIRRALEGKRDLRTALIICESLVAFEKWSARRTTADSALDEAIATGHLVVVESSRDVYWRGSKSDSDWHKQNMPWRLLLALARTRGRNFVSSYDVYGDVETSDSAFARLKNRLINLLPADLRDLIIPVRSPNSGYQLNLPSQEVHFFPASPQSIEFQAPAIVGRRKD